MILNQVSTNAVWGRTLSPVKSPAATADTTAELGCKLWHWAIVCACRLIRPAADRGCAVPALPEPCCHHGARVGSLPYSLGGFPAVPLQRLSMLFYLIDKSLSHRHSCRAVAGKHHSAFRREKTRKEAALDACSHPFRVFQNSRLFNSCCTVVVTGYFPFEVVLRRRMGALCPYPSLFLPNLLRPYLLRPNYGFSLSESRRSA